MSGAELRETEVQHRAFGDLEEARELENEGNEELVDRRVDWKQCIAKLIAAGAVKIYFEFAEGGTKAWLTFSKNSLHKRLLEDPPVNNVSAMAITCFLGCGAGLTCELVRAFERAYKATEAHADMTLSTKEEIEIDQKSHSMQKLEESELVDYVALDIHEIRVSGPTERNACIWRSSTARDTPQELARKMVSEMVRFTKKSKKLSNEIKAEVDLFDEGKDRTLEVRVRAIHSKITLAKEEWKRPYVHQKVLGKMFKCKKAWIEAFFWDRSFVMAAIIFLLVESARRIRG